MRMRASAAVVAIALISIVAAMPSRVAAQQARPPKPAQILSPLQWWCEVYAQVAPGAVLTPAEKGRNVFFSQVFPLDRRNRDDEDNVERRCRASFEVQFGGRFTLVTARAFSAVTPDEADAERRSDMNNSVRVGHTREFRIPEG